MKILSIETSCDETAIAILEADGNDESAQFRILGNALISQIDLHREYGGVFPTLAKREHAKNIIPVLVASLEEAELLNEDTQVMSEQTRDKISEILSREPELATAFFEFISECEPPEIDYVAVTSGPGLEPALWVGISFACALARAWDKPLVTVNHMEGHILSALAKETNPEGATLEIKNTKMPVIALLISGGHTELVLMRQWLSYEILGQTRDDAVGEAFDKVARMLCLPYPGGPEISRIAEKMRLEKHIERPFKLPRPMIADNTCDFSFSGLKTSVLYILKKHPEISEKEKSYLALEFENAVTDVLWKKTSRALDDTMAGTLVIGGGVSANTHIRRTFTEKIREEYSDVTLRIPSVSLTTDNAVMIALAGFYRAKNKNISNEPNANGNLSLAEL